MTAIEAELAQVAAEFKRIILSLEARQQRARGYEVIGDLSDDEMLVVANRGLVRLEGRRP